YVTYACTWFGGEFFFSSRRRHTRFSRDWSSDVCSSDLQVHDALVFSIPKDRLEEVCALVKEAMEVWWQPPDGSGQRVHFPVGMRSEERRVGKECRCRG